MTGTPTRSPGGGGWTHTQRRGYPRYGVLAQPIPAMRRTQATGSRGGNAPRVPGHDDVPRRAQHASRIPANGNPAWMERSESRGGSAGTDERGPQVLVDGRFRNPEGASDADRLE